jgi:hypothetical protein
MPAEARVTSIWKNQKLFVSLALLALGAWFFVDGKWFWPQSNLRWLAHKEYENDKHLDKWPAFAAEKGWSAEPPEKYYDRDQILAQFLLASLLGIAGGLTLVYWSRQKGRVVKTDGEAVYSPNGTRVPFTSIVGLGLKKWEAKGLATVRYEIDGRKGEFILDDYKYDRDPTHEILKEIETHLVSRTPQ